MKKWTYSLGLLSICIGAPLLAAATAPTETSQQSTPYVNGQQWLDQVQQEYNKGAFKPFISKMDEQLKTPQGQQILAKVRDFEEEVRSSEKIKGIREQGKDIEKQFEALSQERNKKLQEVCKNSTEEVCKAVQGLIANSNIPRETEDFNDNKNDPVFAKFHEINNLFIAKNILLAEEASKPDAQTKPSIENTTKLQMALLIERIQQLEALAKENPSSPIVGIVEKIKVTFNKKAPYYHDTIYLTDLAADNKRTKTPAEQKISQIILEYGEKSRQLSQSIKDSAAKNAASAASSSAPTVK